MGNVITGLIGLAAIAILVWLNHRLKTRLYSKKAAAPRAEDRARDNTEILMRSKSPVF